MNNGISKHIVYIVSALIAGSACDQPSSEDVHPEPLGAVNWFAQPELDNATPKAVQSAKKIMEGDYDTSSMKNLDSDSTFPVNSMAFMVVTGTGDNTHKLVGDTLELYSLEPLGQDPEAKPCEGTMLHEFASEARVYGCTATLIADNMVLTAAHCIVPAHLENTYFVFGRTIQSEFARPGDGRRISVPKGHWAKADCVLAGDYDHNGASTPDWAVVQLAQRLEFSSVPLATGSLESKDDVSILAYPLGLPLKQISVTPTGEGIEFDIAGGMSGAALLDAKLAIIGVVRGKKSNLTGALPSTFSGGCRTPSICERGQCEGQPYTPVTALKKWRSAGVEDRFSEFLKIGDFLQPGGICSDRT